jgi:Uma2 family endonuclease
MAKAKILPGIKFTYEDYKSLPFSETRRYELLGGDLIMVPSPSFGHQRISWELEYRLSQYVREHQLGIVLDAPLDVVFGEGSEREVAQPDILFISNERWEIIQDDEIRGAPDLIIEILSPSTADYDRHYKRTLYARHGVKEYWLVDPDSQTIEVLTLGKRGYRRAELYTRDQTLRSPLLPGFEIQLAEIF